MEIEERMVRARMIEHLSIKNFKSIKDLELRCKRVNLFIGEPNAGKSNLLESLAMINWYSSQRTGLREFVRFQNVQNLFHDDFIDRTVEITIDSPPLTLKVMFSDSKYTIQGFNISGQTQRPLGQYHFNIEGNPYGGGGETPPDVIHYYRFQKQIQFGGIGPSFLDPPYGINLFSIVMSNKKYQDTMKSFLKKDGFNLVLKPQGKTFEFQKQVEDVVISYPYALLSDTLQRIIFYIIAIESNKDATLVFEEPESHAFPYYTKYLGEKIGMDERNQYFIATHNPYLLNSILEKTKKDSVAVFVTYFSDYQTKVKSLSGNEISELMSHDPFFNLDSFIKSDVD